MRPFAIGVSVLLVSAGAFAFTLRGGGEGGDSPEAPPPPVNTVFAGVMLRVGLGADTLAAAGVTSEQVAGLASAVRSSYSAATLQSRDDAYVAARQDHDRLKRLVESGKGTAQDLAALRTAEATLATATASRDGYLAGLRTAGLATISASQAALVTRINANRSWGLPVQYLAKDRAEPEWVALRDALATKRISEQDEEETFPQATQTYLASADGASEVATAKVALDSHIASVQTAWNLAASD